MTESLIDAEPGRQELSCAVRMPREPKDAAVLENYLTQHGIKDAVRYLPKDDDELNQALCAGRHRCVIFLDLAALFEPVWKELAELDRWRAAGVEIELARPPEGDAGAWRASVAEVCASLTLWRRAERRRKIVAATLLSALAIASVAALLWLVPPG